MSICGLRLIPVFLVLSITICEFAHVHVDFQFHFDNEAITRMSQSEDKDTDTTQFMVLGDWGGLPDYPFFTYVEQAIAAGMADLAEKQRYQFVLGLGDNFYHDGVSNSHDPRFKETFEDVFRADSLQIPWFMVAGNHDHHANVTAQILYSKYSTRWNFPDFNYTFTAKIGSRGTANSPSVRFVMLDTVVLCGLSDVDYIGQPPQGAAHPDHARRMIQWAEEVLKNSREEYVFVCGHYPVYSIGHHGPTQCLIDVLDPLLRRYNVTAYLNGHDHNLQHIKVAASGSSMDYYTIGSANFISTSRRHKHAVPANSSKFYWADVDTLGGLAGIQLSAEEGLISFYSAGGNVLYTQPIHPRPRVL